MPVVGCSRQSPCLASSAESLPCMRQGRLRVEVQLLVMLMHSCTMPADCLVATTAVSNKATWSLIWEDLRFPAQLPALAGLVTHFGLAA